MYKNKISKEKTHSKFKYKKNIILATMMTIFLFISALLLIPKNINQIYNFDNKNFSNQSEVMEYALSQGRRNQVEDTNYYYKYKNKVYSIQERDEVIDKMIQDAQIREEQTYRNVNEYVISNSGELSSNVKNLTTYNLQKVYKGRNGFAYIDLDEAVKTFQDFDSVILMENLNKNSTNSLEFYNENEAIQYLENIKKESLEQGEESDCYLISGSCQDEGTVKQWLKSSSTYKYRFKDYEWSNFAPADLSQIDIKEDDKVYKDNIFKFQANRDAYWIDINNTGKGSFSGSQFIETNIGNESFNKKIQTGWKLKEESKVNALLSPLLFLSEMRNGVESLVRKIIPESDEWTLLENIFFNDKESRDEFLDDVKKLAQIDLRTGEDGLDYERFEKQMNSKAKNMDSKTKALVFFRKLSNLSLMKNNLEGGQLNGPMQQFDDLCKRTLKKVIYSEDPKMADIYDEMFKEGNPKIFIGDLVDIFLNPASFQYKKDDTRLAFANTIKKINEFGDAIMDPLSQIDKLTKKYFDEKGKSTGLKMTREDQEKIAELQNLAIEQKFEKDQEILLDDGQYHPLEMVLYENKKRAHELTLTNEGKITTVNEAGIPKPSLLTGLTTKFNTLQQVWDMGNKLTPFKYKTMSLDFGDGQELLYTYLSFELFGLEWNSQDIAQYLPTSQLYTGVGREKDQGYRIRGSYFDSKNDAIDYLKTLMVRDPHEYTEIQQFNISVMDRNESGLIDKDGLLSVEEQLDNFVNVIFDKYYKNLKQKFFTDGFGNKFDNKIDALNSMRENITNRNFIKKYQWKDQYGVKRNYDNFDEMIEVQNNYIINTYIEQKSVISSDLIGQNNYDKIQAQSGGMQNFYSLLDGSRRRYFKTYDDAYFFVFNKNNFELNIEQVINYQIIYKGETFGSEEEFINWVRENTKIINGRGMVN